MSGVPKSQIAKGVDLAEPWRALIQALSDHSNDLKASGTTRPTQVGYIGQPFYDTTLQKVVFASSLNPIVWRDAMGNVV